MMTGAFEPSGAAGPQTHRSCGKRPSQDVLDAVLLARIAPGAVLSLREFKVACRAADDELEATLLTLNAMGMVSVEGDDVRIAPCNISDVLANLDRRRALEIMIARAAAANASEAQQQAMTASQALQKRCALVGDMEGLMNAERQLEALLGVASGLAAEVDELKRIKMEFRRSWCAANRLKTFSNVADIRTALVAAIVARDADAAEAQIHVFFDHLLRTY
jgi:DNA-binding GntR family transcriptional regulator